MPMMTGKFQCFKNWLLRFPSSSLFQFDLHNSAHPRSHGTAQTLPLLTSAGSSLHPLSLERVWSLLTDTAAWLWNKH